MSKCIYCKGLGDIQTETGTITCGRCLGTGTTEAMQAWAKAFARLGGKAKARAMSKADRREAALKMVKAKAEKRLKRISQAEQQQ